MHLDINEDLLRINSYMQVLQITPKPPVSNLMLLLSTGEPLNQHIDVDIDCQVESVSPSRTHVQTVHGQPLGRTTNLCWLMTGDNKTASQHSCYQWKVTHSMNIYPVN